MRVELLIIRNPGKELPDIEVFIDGQQVPDEDITEEVVDPTRGGERTEWDRVTEDLRTRMMLDLSNTYRDAIVAARDEWADDEHLVDDRDERDERQHAAYYG